MECQNVFFHAEHLSKQPHEACVLQPCLFVCLHAGVCVCQDDDVEFRPPLWNMPTHDSTAGVHSSLDFVGRLVTIARRWSVDFGCMLHLYLQLLQTRTPACDSMSRASSNPGHHDLCQTHFWGVQRHGFPHHHVNDACRPQTLPACEATFFLSSHSHPTPLPQYVDPSPTCVATPPTFNPGILIFAALNRESFQKTLDIESLSLLS